MQKRWVQWVGLVCLMVVATTVRVALTTSSPSYTPTADALAAHNAYFATNPSFSETATYMEAVARREGGAYAFEVLKNGSLPPGMDTHLIGHFVGDIMYEQEGIHGMRYCDEAVGYACAHSVVINALLRDGPGVFDVINDVCASIGLPGSYDMCFHGFGHGVLAYTEFHLPEAIELCDLVGTEKNNDWEEQECLGGVIMEMRGGIHDPELWAVNGKPYLDPDNPLAMCQADYLPEKYREMCYIYITPFIFDYESPADIPPPTVYADSMAWCERIDDAYERSDCYAGFGKEYVGFALGRDVRYLNFITPEQAGLVHDWCNLAPTEEGALSCMEFALYSVYRSGSIGFDGALTFCSQARTQRSADMCYHHFFRVAHRFHGPGRYERQLCPLVPPNRVAECQAAFRSGADWLGSPS
ncbi:MAG TPA: hypothetical protein VKP88_01990 [Candidatus Paceibacterota bacterium]|nr:hypothetical protein [Candidatus Paceibacterota bacterium]